MRSVLAAHRGCVEVQFAGLGHFDALFNCPGQGASDEADFVCIFEAMDAFPQSVAIQRAGINALSHRFHPLHIINRAVDRAHAFFQDSGPSDPNMLGVVAGLFRCMERGNADRFHALMELLCAATEEHIGRRDCDCMLGAVICSFRHICARPDSLFIDAHGENSGESPAQSSLC